MIINLVFEDCLQLGILNPIWVRSIIDPSVYGSQIKEKSLAVTLLDNFVISLLPANRRFLKSFGGSDLRIYNFR